MKFTEEQYRQIVEAWDSKNTYRQATTAVIETINSFSTFAFTEFSGDEALALGNPVTREYAHERFVEKEKRYVWNSKKTDSAGHCMRLFRDRSLIVRGFTGNYSDEVSDDEKLTESEIREWGYDPERFDKEEVE